MSNSSDLLRAAKDLRRREVVNAAPTSEEDQVNLSLRMIREVLRARSIDYLELITGKLRLSTSAWHWLDGSGEWQVIHRWSEVSSKFPKGELFKLLISEIKKIR